MTSEFFSKVGYGINFYRYIWRERQNYDAVFVHMNQEYVLLGWCLWRLLGKPIALWRTHPKGNWLAGLAVFFSDMVFCTSRFAYVARFKQTVLVPVGVDTEFLRPDPAVEKSPKSLLFLSRLSPIKKPDVFIEALAILKEKNVDFFARIIGDAPERDQAYALKLKDLIVKHGLGQRVEFKKGVPFSAVPAVFNAYEISVNATPSGSMDKTMFEAMACGTLVLASNKNLETILPADLAKLLVFKEADGQDLAAKAEVLLSLPADKAAEIKRRLREIVVGQQSLDRLVEKLVKRLQNND